MLETQITHTTAQHEDTPSVTPNFDCLDDLRAEFPGNPFPIDVFPNAVQDIINATHLSLNFPPDFTGAAMLYTASVAIGNAYRVEVKGGWQEGGVLYMAIVGRPGTNKSHPISFALKPLEQRDSQNYTSYLTEKREYDAIAAMPKKDRDAQVYDDVPKPTWRQLLVSDFTPEALAAVHLANSRGIGVYADELAGWVRNFNRYNKGSEEEFWISAWSGKPIRINRKTTEPTYVPNPFISVIGTIQPAVLNDIASSRTESGFLDRLLFVVPDDLKKEYWAETELPVSVSGQWQGIVARLLDVSSPETEVLKFTPEARRHLYNWQRDVTDTANRAHDDTTAGITAKIEVYAVRLALILEILHSACSQHHADAVGIDAVTGAIRLTEYFKRTALSVHATLSQRRPLDALPADRKRLYQALPDSFTTAEALQVGADLNTPERTLKRFIDNDKLFVKASRGHYMKLH